MSLIKKFVAFRKRAQDRTPSNIDLALQSNNPLIIGAGNPKPLSSLRLRKHEHRDALRDLDLYGKFTMQGETYKIYVGPIASQRYYYGLYFDGRRD